MLACNFHFYDICLMSAQDFILYIFKYSNIQSLEFNAEFYHQIFHCRILSNFKVAELEHELEPGDYESIHHISIASSPHESRYYNNISTKRIQYLIFKETFLSSMKMK